MSVTELRIAIRKALDTTHRFDEGVEARAIAVSRPLETVWPVIEGLAESSARLAELAIVISLGRHEVFTSSELPFDRESHLDLDFKEQLTGSFVVPVVGLADVTVFFAAREEGVLADGPLLAGVNESRAKLMESMRGAFEALIEATANFHSRAVNMAHEVTMVLQGTAALLADVFEEVEVLSKNNIISDDFKQSAEIVEAEYECTLYLLQNFLSDAGYIQYRASQSKRIEEVDPNEVFDRLLKIYSRTERGQRLSFVSELPRPCRKILGQRAELARAFHNVISNAVKYSYISGTDGAERKIRVYAQIPYGPKSQLREWAICVENYGVGLQKEEQYVAFQSGFRGRGAVEQTGLGAGIGLSEVQKIMHAHNGRARIRSRFLHHGRTGEVYLTTVSLVFSMR